MKLFYLVCTIILFCNCSSIQNTKYYILTNKAQKISSESLIISKGEIIGRVNKIDFEKNKFILITIEINKSFKISKKSDIFLTGDINSSKPNSIEIFQKNDEKTIYYKIGDTLKLNLDYFKILID